MGSVPRNRSHGEWTAQAAALEAPPALIVATTSPPLVVSSILTSPSVDRPEASPSPAGKGRAVAAERRHQGSTTPGRRASATPRRTTRQESPAMCNAVSATDAWARLPLRAAPPR